MRNRSYIGSLTALFVLVIVIGLISLACGRAEGNNANTNANVTISPTPTPDPCAAVKDSTIVDAIYGKLIKNPDIFPLIKQINISATAGAVTVIGWVDTAAKTTEVIDTVKGVECVKTVDSTQFYDKAPGPPVQPGVGCGQGWVRCGDICVPDHCFWSNDAPSPVPTNSNNKPGMNSNSTPGTNANSTKSNSNSKY